LEADRRSSASGWAGEGSQKCLPVAVHGHCNVTIVIRVGELGPAAVRLDQRAHSRILGQACCHEPLALLESGAEPKGRKRAIDRITQPLQAPPE